MLGEARSALITDPHTSIVPGVMIFLIVIEREPVGDGVRDALEPRLRSGALARPKAVTDVRREGFVPRTPQKGAAGPAGACRRSFMAGGRGCFVAQSGGCQPPREAGRVPWHHRRIGIGEIR